MYGVKSVHLVHYKKLHNLIYDSIIKRSMSTYILIDIDRIILRYKLYDLINKLGSLPEESTEDTRRAVVLGISHDSMNTMNSLPNSQNKLDFINSNSFTINSFAFLLCNNDICEIHNLYDTNMIPFIIKSVLPNITLWISVKINNTTNINNLVSHGFTSPFTTRLSPLHNIVFDDTICLLKIPGKISSDLGKVYNDIEHITNIQRLNYPGNVCNITAKFTEETINQLRKIPIQDGTEIAGAMKILGNHKENEKIIYDIEINNKSIVKGHNEHVEVLNDKYNFHTHPRDAYIRNGVNYAWPSDHDYIGFLKAVFYSNSVFHVVVTLEGIYIISISPDYASDINTIKYNYSYIEKVYNIPHNAFKTPEDYIIHVNKLKIFTVIYLSWNNSMDPFTIYYPKTNGGCTI